MGLFAIPVLVNLPKRAWVPLVPKLCPVGHIRQAYCLGTIVPKVPLLVELPSLPLDITPSQNQRVSWRLFLQTVHTCVTRLTCVCAKAAVYLARSECLVALLTARPPHRIPPAL